MARSRPHTRKRMRGKPHVRPRGAIRLTAEGFGFVQTAEGEFFVPASKTGGAADGDLVEIAPLQAYRRRDAATAAGAQATTATAAAHRKPAARVAAVVARAHETVLGRYEVADPFGVVVPLDPGIPYDIFTLRSDNPHIEDGALVRVRMREYPTRSTSATGVVEEVLEGVDEGKMAVELVIARHHLETSFSEEALAQAALARVDAQGALAEGYADERARFVFTIDPVDARDFDDALSVAQDGSGNLMLGVHIADVAHYVPPGSAVDLEARKRATSTYLVDRVLPMLPEKLSNEVCSLAPGVARRAVTADIAIDGQGNVVDTAFRLSVIESKARLSYDQAQCFIAAFDEGRGSAYAFEQARTLPVPEGAARLSEALAERIYDCLGLLVRFARARMRLRASAGGIDFATREAKVQLDACGVATEVLIRERTDATSCVEEAMICCNECVARHLVATHAPGVFRVHDRPAADALAGLIPVLQEFGYDTRVSLDEFAVASPHALQQVLRAAAGKPEEMLISQLLLRAQQRAVYRAEVGAHYGLASEAYCHFTSPIRRYPDLVVHRSLRSWLAGGNPYAPGTAALDTIAEHSSRMERVAEAAARESQELKLAEYMGRFVDQVFPGVISGVGTFGIYVQLENTAEGIVPLRALGDEYFSFDPVAHKLVGQDSGAVFRLGQPLEVRLRGVPEHAVKLDFRLA